MKITRTEQSSHWYHRDGTACHEVIAKTTGLPRPTNVADARKLNLVPSVTNILNMKAKPALNTWLQDNAIRAALATPQNPGEPEDQWHSRIAVESDRIGREAAEWGTLLHEQLEHLLTGGAFTATGEILDYVRGAETWLRENVETTIQAEQSVVGDLGYAGRLDVHAMLKDGRRAVIDFKSQKLVGKRAPSFYKEWSMQLAAYGDCLREPGEPLPVLISLIIPSDAPGPVFPKEWDNGEAALVAFHACFRLWCFDRDYTPAP
jgi:hypothetical protein